MPEKHREKPLSYHSQAPNATPHFDKEVHRDVKTENILLQGAEPLVADFGLACEHRDAAQMKRRCGSAGFVAPEVCLGEPYGYKVDTFGAGKGDTGKVFQGLWKLFGSYFKAILKAF